MALKVSVVGLFLLGALPVGAEWLRERFDDAVVSVRLVRSADDLRSLLGTDLEGDYILAEVIVEPLYNSKVMLTREDFLMRSRRNNERSLAMSPHEISGGSVLVMGSRRVSNGPPGIFSQENDPVIVGGAPGAETRPRTLGGLGRSLGNPPGRSSQELSLNSEERTTTSLLERLEQHELPMGETGETIQGYLYFQIPFSYKLKHYQFTYDGSAGEFSRGFSTRKIKP
jgi:hypothetical protein